MSRPPNKPTPSADTLNFLLTCSEGVLRNYELMPALRPGVAHLATALRHIQRSLPRPKCRCCPKPCDRNSVLYCPFHLAEARERIFPKSKSFKKPRDPKDKTVAAAEKIIFLLNCSERALRRFELARVNGANSLRNELHGVLYEQIDAPDLRGKVFATLDKLVDQMAQLGLARWFRAVDREAISRALEVEEDPLLQAKVRIRDEGRSESELMSQVFSSLDPGEAHRVAALAYAERNVAMGKCANCPRPLDRNSVRFCTEHLRKARERMRVEAKKLNKPPHGRAPGTLKALAENRKKHLAKLKRP
jgi:hypothetical protein